MYVLGGKERGEMLELILVAIKVVSLYRYTDRQRMTTCTMTNSLDGVSLKIVHWKVGISNLLCIQVLSSIQ